jgi:hypothetical protein
VLHSEILPEHDCGGELIELPEDKPTSVHFAQCARCGTEFTFVPDSDWVTVVYPGMPTAPPPSRAPALAPTRPRPVARAHSLLSLSSQAHAACAACHLSDAASPTIAQVIGPKLC